MMCYIRCYRWQTLCIGLFSFLTLIARADNFGVYGAVYPIAEPDMLRGIHHKLVAMQSSGELERVKKAFIARSIQHILRPQPVSFVTDLGDGISHSHYFDPTLVLSHDIFDANGNVVAKAGTTVNPLKKVRFDEALLFINADNTKQIAWAKALIKQPSRSYHQTKVILVNGDIDQASKALHQKVYFDQKGVLCKKLGIHHTPSIVYEPLQKGHRVAKLVVKECRDA